MNASRNPPIGGPASMLIGASGFEEAVVARQILVGRHQRDRRGQRRPLERIADAREHRARDHDRHRQLAERAPASTINVPTNDTVAAAIITRLRDERSTMLPANGVAIMPGTVFASSSVENAETECVV